MTTKSETTEPAKIRISKRSVDAAEPHASRYILWDIECKGFGLSIQPTGVKSFVFRYRTPEGRLRQPTIGEYGDYTPDQARAKAEEYRAVVKAGGDPLGEKRERLHALTVAALLDKYLASEQFQDKAPSTQAIDRGRIERHLKPLLGRSIADKLSAEDVKRALAAIANGKTAADIKTKARGRARVKGGKGTARMAIALLRAVFGWAIAEGYAKTNPCDHIKLGVSGTRETIIEDTAGYARLFEAIDRLEATGKLRRAVADAIRLITLTGARRGEIAGLRWSYVDLKRGLITIPPGSHKTGKATGKPRTIGLPSAAQVLIARQPAGSGDDLVFQPTKGASPLSLSKSWRVVRVEAKLPADLGLHGLRHSVASHLAVGGAGASEIMTQMGHAQLGTVARYVHFAETARSLLAEKAAGPAMAGMAIAEGRDTASITPIGRK